MVHVFDMQPGKVQIPVETPERNERFMNPARGEEGVRAVSAWRDGARRSVPEELPKVLVADKPRKTWPDAFTGWHGILVVSGRARDVIERFDPGLHQFFEVPLRTKRGVEIEGPWFIVNVTVRQSSIVVEKSRVLANDDFPDTLCSFWVNSTTKDVVVDTKRLFPDIHFWREARFEGSRLGSDASVAALKEAGVKFFPSYRATNLADVETK
ncbi:imm11 family protein [Jannaschia rubra]|uniref:Immunity MXAN-0049 protein domain-containing protein n=1 Tax=Jannaschia rubra TaxID=282197 RepID=A0A0M6XT36_9RHOB|nr:DUF1629 domain-containing protein [Jannaschia rubra]CTQ33403.1 hypothetical protein JAN5088_02185 [Jannaschia rubra]SFG00977.1 hypothetical protein SAMN04488517_102231 [Jannaschia rubra]